MVVWGVFFLLPIRCFRTIQIHIYCSDTQNDKSFYGDEWIKHEHNTYRTSNAFSLSWILILISFDSEKKSVGMVKWIDRIEILTYLCPMRLRLPIRGYCFGIWNGINIVLLCNSFQLFGSNIFNGTSGPLWFIAHTWCNASKATANLSNCH